MSGTMHINIHNRNNANACVALMLALLAGCAAFDAKQTAPSGAESRLCESDTDTFCIESDQQKAAKLNQQGVEFAAKLDYGQAVGLFKQAIALDAADPEYYYNLGVAYSYKGMVAEEEAAYLAAEAIKPGDPDDRKLKVTLTNVYYNLACLYALQGKKEQAFEQLDKLVGLGTNKLFHLMQSDKDLDSLRDDPRFKKALDKIAGGGKSPQPAPPPAQ